MGLPDGHVTAVPGLSRAAQLHALGNGVVPQQAEHALRLLLDRATLAAPSPRPCPAATPRSRARAARNSHRENAR